MHLRQARSVAHQAADFRKLANVVDGGNGMPRCQRGKLNAPAIEERIGADHLRTSVAKAASISRLSRAWTTSISTPLAEAAAATFVLTDWAFALFGLTSNPIRA